MLAAGIWFLKHQFLSILVEELYGGLTEDSINETIQSACLEEQEYQSIKENVTKLFS